MSVSQHIPDNIKRVARCVGYAAWLDEPDTWLGLPVVLAARLEPQQRAALAYAALRSLSDDHAAMVCDAVLPDGAGQPIAPLFNHMDEAAFWADMAAPEELEAYCLATFKAMPRVRQAAFLDFVQGRQAA